MKGDVVGWAAVGAALGEIGGPAFAGLDRHALLRLSVRTTLALPVRTAGGKATASRDELRAWVERVRRVCNRVAL